MIYICREYHIAHFKYLTILYVNYASIKLNNEGRLGERTNNQPCLKRVVVVQSLSHVQLFVTLWTAAHQPSLSLTISQGLLKFMSIESWTWWCHPTISSSVSPFSSCSQSFPAPGSFQRSQFFASGGQSTGISALASVLPMNTQDWSPLEWTGLLQHHSSKASILRHSAFFTVQLSHP